MPWSYAGVPVRPLHPNQSDTAEFWAGHRIDEFSYQAFLVPGIQHLPTPYLPKQEPPRLNVLSWPNGAHRWATCYLLATGEELSAIRQRIGTVPTAQTLYLTDETIGSIQTQMFLISARPIQQKGSNEWYMLTLTDVRYFWFQSGDAASPTNPVSWSALLSSLFSSLGVAPSIGSIASAYLTPNTARWDVGVQPIPLLIEAACRQIGMQVVRLLDGTVQVIDYAAAQAADTARWTTIQNSVLAGGRLAATDLARGVPSSVDVMFFDGTNTNKTLFSLALSAYGGIGGVSSGTARYTADSATPSAPQKAALATRAAQDYYNWYLSLTDCTLRGVQSIQPTGMDDVVEWVHHPDQIVTRIIRPEYSDRNVYGEEFPVGDSTGTGSGPTESCISYQVRCENGYLVQYRCEADAPDTWVYDSSSGIPCAPTIDDPELTTPKYPVVFPYVSNVCPILGHLSEINTNYTATLEDDVLVATVPGITISLPSPATNSGGEDQLLIKNLSGGNIDVSGNIDGSSAPVTLADGESVWLINNGTTTWLAFY